MSLLGSMYLSSCKGPEYPKNEGHYYLLLSNEKTINIYKQANEKSEVVVKAPTETTVNLLWCTDTWSYVNFYLLDKKKSKKQNKNSNQYTRYRAYVPTEFVYEVKNGKYVKPSKRKKLWESGFYVVKGKKPVPLLANSSFYGQYNVLICDYDTIGWLEPDTWVKADGKFFTNYREVRVRTLNTEEPTVGYVFCHQLKPRGQGVWKSLWWPIRWMISPKFFAGHRSHKITNFLLLNAYNTSMPVWRRFIWHTVGLIVWFLISMLLHFIAGGANIFKILWNTALPIAYLILMPMSMWFCYPSLVGWGWAIFGSVIVLAFLALFVTRCKTYVTGFAAGETLITRTLMLLYGITNGLIVCIFFIAIMNQNLDMMLILYLIAFFSPSTSPSADKEGMLLMDQFGRIINGHGDGTTFYGDDGKIYHKSGTSDTWTE